MRKSTKRNTSFTTKRVDEVIKVEESIKHNSIMENQFTETDEDFVLNLLREETAVERALRKNLAKDKRNELERFDLESVKGFYKTDVDWEIVSVDGENINVSLTAYTLGNVIEDYTVISKTEIVEKIISFNSGVFTAENIRKVINDLLSDSYSC